MKKVPARTPAMATLDRVASVIRSHSLVSGNDRVIVAVSGGPDSLALLHILGNIDLTLNLVAVYIDHGLRPLETDHEKKIINAYCTARHIPFAVYPVNVRGLMAKGKISPEEAARILRYKALEELRRKYNAKWIAVGHTADDQVEEFFIRLIRGSSSKGLSGMRFREKNIIRPLLFETKSQLIDLLAVLGIPWCQDSSNLDRQFLRNRVRLDLLPLLEENFNPNVRKTILQDMDILAEEDKYLEEQTSGAYLRCVDISESPENIPQTKKLIIKKANLRSEHLAIRRRVVEKSCWHMGIRPTYEQISTLVAFIDSGRTGSELHLADGVRAEQSPHGVFFSRPLPRGQRRGSSLPAPSIHLWLPGPGTYPVAGTGKELVLEQKTIEAGQGKEKGELQVDLAKISFPLLLRSFLPGEKFHPCGGPGQKKIARYFNEKKIPQKNRQAWPILISRDQVVALVGLQLDHNFRIATGSREILAIHWRDRQG